MKTFRNSHIDKIPVRPAARDTAILVDGRAERDPASAIGGGSRQRTSQFSTASLISCCQALPSPFQLGTGKLIAAQGAFVPSEK